MEKKGKTKEDKPVLPEIDFYKLFLIKKMDLDILEKIVNEDHN